MSAAFSAGIEEANAPAETALLRASALLDEVLQLLDTAHARPEIGALVQSALDEIGEPHKN
jgi:hypothetical protein